MKYFKFRSQYEKAKYQNKLEIARKVWLADEAGMKHKDIVYKFGFLPAYITEEHKDYMTHMLPALRKVSRYKKSVNDTFKPIELGTFPYNWQLQ